MRRQWNFRLAVLIVLTALPGIARADKYWVGTGTGNWSDSANWSETAGGSGGAGAPGVGDDVSIFHSDHANRDIVLDASISIGTLSLAALQSDATTVIHHPSGIDLQTSLTKFGRYYGQTRYEQSGGTHATGFLDLAPAQDRATYALSAGTLSAGVLRIGYYGYGTFLHSGGTVNAGTFQLARGTIYSGGGTYLMNGSGASLVVAGDEQISYRSHGYFNQSAGNHLVKGTLYVGATGGGDAIYQMSGGSLQVNGVLAVGTGYGGGTFTQSGGAVIIGTPASPQDLRVGLESGTGYLELGGSASSLIVTGNERIGFFSTFTQSGGFHSIGGTFLTGQSSTMSGGTLIVHGTQAFGGTFNQTGGFVNLTSPEARHGPYANYFLSGGSYQAPSLQPYGFTWSGGELNIGTLVLTGRMTVAHGSEKTLRLQGLRKPHVFTYGYGTLDLTNSNAIIDYDGNSQSQILDIREFLATGHLISSTGAPSHRLGYADNADPLLQKSTFSGETFPAGDFSQLLIMYTLGGDANLDGRVNLIDLAALATHWQSGDSFWTEGDFNYDGTVDQADLGILATNWNSSQASLDEALVQNGLPAVAIPEPAGLMVIALLAALHPRPRSFSRGARPARGVGDERR